MYSTATDFYARLSRHLFQDFEGLEERGDLVFNSEVRKYFDTFREAAVLVSVIDRPDGPTTLLNLRPQHLKDHAGQIGFPGGKVEQGDRDRVHTAAREAQEEVGIEAGRIEALGFLKPYVTGSGFRIIPVLAKVDLPDDLDLDPNEVAEAFEVPLSFLMNPGNHSHGYVDWLNKPRFYYEMAYREMNRDWRIWGVTAGIIRELYETIYPEFPVDRPYLEPRPQTA